MYGITDLKKGTVIQLKGTPYKVVQYEHSTLGRGGAVVRTKLKNLTDGSLLSKTFRGNDKVEPVHINPRKAQYLYNDNEQAYFMLSDTYEQISLSKKSLAGQLGYLKEGADITLLYVNSRPASLDLPVKVKLLVLAADPGIRGDTVSNTLKSARTETGLTVQVPLFIKAGDHIMVDTRTGEYVERT